MHHLITGIQQVGIGVQNAEEAKHLYKDLFAMNALVFDDKSPATLMTQYTGNKLEHRHAILSMNLSGGGGFEIWQFTSTQPALQPSLSFGDIGIFAVKIKSQNVAAAYEHFKNKQQVSLSALEKGDDNKFHFWLTDTYGNNFEIIESKEWFHSNNHICGGVAGVVIGVSDMQQAIEFYSNLLGEFNIDYDIEKKVTGTKNNEINSARCVLLKKEKSCKGAFSKLLGHIQIELVQLKDQSAVKKIFENRFWGDCGFIHVCFDVLNMNDLKNIMQSKKYSFTVDSNNSYAMETSSGRFCYVEDPDGTLIELVETHKVPILKSIGWHLNLKKRKKNNPLPDWMIKMLGLNKIK